MNVPSELFAGDSATWKDDATVDRLGGVIDNTWTLKYVFSFPTLAVTITATNDGTGWTATLAKTNTGVAVGTYFWQAYAETGSRRETIGRGSITIKDAAAANTSTLGKSQTQQDLEAVQAAMRSMISGGAVQEYTIGSRSMRKMTITDLIMWEGKLKARLAREKAAEDAANGLGNPNNVYVRFR